MYNYLTNLRPVLLGAPLQFRALSARLVRLWVNPALFVGYNILINLLTYLCIYAFSSPAFWCVIFQVLHVPTLRFCPLFSFALSYLHGSAFSLHFCPSICPPVCDVDLPMLLFSVNWKIIAHVVRLESLHSATPKS